MTTFRIVGAGRAGLSFSDALTAAGWQQVGLLTHRDFRLRTTEFVTAATGTDVLFLAVPDDAIGEVAAAIAPGTAVLLHCSGAKTLEVLKPHAKTGSLHPLLSLPDREIGSRRLSDGATFAVAGHSVSQDVVKALDGKAIAVAETDRPLYHATASIAANHLVALCAQVERLSGKIGIPTEAYWGLMRSTLGNVADHGAIPSLTGPAARGDHNTIRAHLAALDEQEHRLYLTLSDEAARLAGRLPSSTFDPPRIRSGTSENGRPMKPEILTTIGALRSRLDEHRAAGQSIGFTPTMGYLHDGHASLMRAARQANDVVVASIFVNPLQFAPDEDLSTYPRDLQADADLAGSNGVDYLFVPTTKEMYPMGAVLTSVSVAEISEAWDGDSRPTHFTGVATVVNKLFNIVGACRSYFGEKDFQQLAVIQRMVADLSLPVEVIGCPIIREADGLAMSSRNSYLSPEDRAAAVVLRRALDAGTASIESGETDPAQVVNTMTEVVLAEPRAQLDYAAAVDPGTLITPDVLGPATRLLIAAHLGSTRLIDNCGIGTASATINDRAEQPKETQ